MLKMLKMLKIGRMRADNVTLYHAHAHVISYSPELFSYICQSPRIDWLCAHDPQNLMVGKRENKMIAKLFGVKNLLMDFWHVISSPSVTGRFSMSDD